MTAGSQEEIGRDELVSQLQQLGVRPGGVLLAHSSFRAVRPVEGGPMGLIQALICAVGEAGTLVMPSWGDDDNAPFNPAATPVAGDLGVVAATFAGLDGVVRSNHSQAFAAFGPLATRISADPLPLPPHIPASPVGRVLDSGGQILLLGVGHDANSTLHLAELIAGVPYGTEKHCTVLEGGEAVRVAYMENDHCCSRFALLDEWLRPAGLQREGLVGHAHARLTEAKDVVSMALTHLRRDPLVFLHAPGDGCDECDDARRSIG